eukprot:scaffold204494_cov33-Prasinocladus_malaysianus.AAC.1
MPVCLFLRAVSPRRVYLPVWSRWVPGVRPWLWLKSSQSSVRVISDPSHQCRLLNAHFAAVGGM